MKWLLLSMFAISIGVVVALGGCSSCDACGLNDAGTEAGACASPVSGGQVCSNQGATACGNAPVCTDIGGGTTTCTCSGGKWDCGQCPACGSTIYLGHPCGIGQVCSGPTTAVQCDGTTQAVSGDCICGGGFPGSGWSCSGVTTKTCPADAGSDASMDASMD
jgi:hypothetical protein